MAPAGTEMLDQLARRCGSSRGVSPHPETDRRLELRSLGGIDPSPWGQNPCRRRPRQQSKRRSRQRVDIARSRRRAVRGELRCPEAGGTAAAVQPVRCRGQPEVDQLDQPSLGQDQVAWLDITMDHRRVLRVKMRQRLGRLGEIREYARRRQPGRPRSRRSVARSSAVDPVHRDDVLISVEEVLPYQAEAPGAAESRAGSGLRSAAPHARASSRTGRIFSATNRSC